MQDKVNFKAHSFDLGMWNDVEKFLSEVSKEPKAVYVETSIESMKSLCVSSLVNPAVKIFLLTCVHPVDKQEEIVGIASCVAISNPASAGLLTHCYIQACYVKSKLSTINYALKSSLVPADAGKLLLEKINDWAKSRGCANICANVRMDGPIAGFERKYGFQQWHHVIGKKVE